MFSPNPAELGEPSAHTFDPSTKACPHHLLGCKGSQPWGGRGEAHRASQLPKGQLSVAQEKCPRQLMGRPPDGVCDTSPVFWWVLGPDCCTPSLPQTLNCADYLSILSGVRKNVPFGQHLHRCSLSMLSLSSKGETVGQRGLSEYWPVPKGEGWYR